MMLCYSKGIDANKVESIAKTVLRNSRERFSDGVIDEAVKQATGLVDDEKIMDAIETAFDAHRISIRLSWDGSIG